MSTHQADEDETLPVLDIGKVPLENAREQFKQALRELRPRPEPPKGRPRRWLLLVAIVLIAIAVIDMLPAGFEGVPAPLIGAWQTTDPGYADQGFELASDAIGFSQGARRVSVWYPVIAVASDSLDEGLVAYRITYDDQGTALEFWLTLDPTESTVRLDNQPTVVWRSD